MAEPKIDQVLKRGIEAHQAGQVQEADRLYTSILKAQPKHPGANHNMGLLAVGVGKVEQALPFFKTALEANPSIAQFWLSFIDALITLDKLVDAEAVLDQAKSKGAKGDGFSKLDQRLQEAKKQYPSDTKFIETMQEKRNFTLDIAIQSREAGDFNQAIDLLKDEMNHLSEDADMLTLLSHCYLLKDRADLAKFYLDKARKIAPENASVGWNTARLMLKEQKPLEALKVAKDTSQRFPDDVEGMGVLGACLKANYGIMESLDVLNRAIELNPNYAEALINRGLIRLSQKNKLEALADLELAHALKPYIKQIWDLVIGLKVEAQEYSDAIVLLINMIEIDPENEKRFATLALCYQHLKDFDSAIEAYNKALAIKPDYVEACNNMGNALKDQGKLEKAIEAFKKTLEIDPDNANAFYNLGNALKGKGKLEEAIEFYNKALAIKPDYANAHCALGNTLKKQGKLKEAIEVYNKALTIKPDYAEAYNNMGNALKDQGKLEEAIEAYKKVITIKPDYAKPYNNMGNALKEQGKLEKAIEAYNKALAIEPNNADAYCNMGVTLQDQGELEEAIEAYNKALAIKPNNAGTHNNMGVTLQDQGKLEEAIEAYNKALAIEPNNADAYYNMGITLKAQGKLAEAIEAYNEALAIKPDYAEAYNNMGNALQDEGELEEAIEAYNNALAVKPGYAEATESLLDLAVQLLPVLANYGCENNNSDIPVKPEVMRSPMYQIQNAIKAYLKADFSNAVSHIRNFEACDQKLLGELSSGNKVFCNAYNIFLRKLLETDWDNTPASAVENKVYHLGESHCLSFAHQSIAIDDSKFTITPRITFGAKAFHLSRVSHDRFKAITKANFISLPKNSRVFISYGEIDCRPNEGFISAARKLEMPIEQLVEETVMGYVGWFSDQNASQGHRLYFINVPAPVYHKEHSADQNSEVAKTVALFNAALRKYSLRHNFDIVDVFKFTVGNEGFSNGIFHVDNFHLGATAVPEIERQLS